MVPMIERVKGTRCGLPYLYKKIKAVAAPATVGGESHPTYATGETWEGRMWAMTREPVYLPLTRYRRSARRGVRA